MLIDPISAAAEQRERDAPPTLEPPRADDGAHLWRLARVAGELDVNSPYHYVLWCRDFAATSVVARDAGRPVGFVTGYQRPDSPDTLFVWQVAVDPEHRRRGLARRMLDHLGTVMADRGCHYLEVTITPDNAASIRTFEGFARAHGAPMTGREGFGSELFPDHHAPERLYRIGPVRQRLSTGA